MDTGKAELGTRCLEKLGLEGKEEGVAVLVKGELHSAGERACPSGFKDSINLVKTKE